jgi:hypothetical protein
MCRRLQLSFISYNSSGKNPLFYLFIRRARNMTVVIITAVIIITSQSVLSLFL